MRPQRRGRSWSDACSDRDDTAHRQGRRRRRGCSGAGVHSYLAVPLIARGEVLGTLSLYRTVNARPFDEQDLTLATELAARAAICVDNARLYGRERNTALTLQRSLLPRRPPRSRRPRHRLPLSARGQRGRRGLVRRPRRSSDGRIGLVVGDVMGKGVHAAAIMGQLRTATRALARLDLPPAELLRHLDDIAGSLGDSIATCVYAVCDPQRDRCQLANAGHLPPMLVRPDGRAEYLDIPSGVPLGVGGVSFEPRRRNWQRGRCSRCSRTAWWRIAGSPSMSDCRPCYGCWRVAGTHSRRPATECSAACAGSGTTMWRSFSHAGRAEPLVHLPRGCESRD